MKKIELTIKGMHCNSCTILIKDALMENNGVKEAIIDLKKNKATILFDEKIIEEKKLIQSIKNEGYDAVIIK